MSVDNAIIERVWNLTSRQSLQESVKEMEAAEQKVLVMKGLVDSDRESLQDDLASTC